MQPKHTESQVRLVFGPGELEKERFRLSFIYQQLQAEGVPLTFTAPPDRDATPKDVKFAGHIKIDGNLVEAFWS